MKKVSGGTGGNGGSGGSSGGDSSKAVVVPEAPLVGNIDDLEADLLGESTERDVPTYSVPDKSRKKHPASPPFDQEIYDNAEAGAAADRANQDTYDNADSYPGGGGGSSALTSANLDAVVPDMTYEPVFVLKCYTSISFLLVFFFFFFWFFLGGEATPLLFCC
jgi:hypothetical protein